MISYNLYRTLNINIKYYLKTGDKWDPHWLYYSNLVSSVSIGNKVVRENSLSKLVDAIIFYHYPNKLWENIRGQVDYFPLTKEGFQEFHSFMHKKLKKHYD